MNLERNVNILQQMLEEEKNSHQTTRKNLQTVQNTVEQFKRICKLAVEEFEELQTKYIQEVKKSERLRCIAQDHTNDFENVSDVREQIEAELREAWERTLEHLNHCVIDADNRAFVAEQKVDMLQKKVQELEKRIQHQCAVLPSVIPSSLQSPPSLPTTNFNPIGSLMSLIGAGKKMPLKAVPHSAKEQKLMDEMIDKIRKGEVHLKPVKKDFLASKPSALDEMKNILNSLHVQDNEKKTESLNELLYVFEHRKQKSLSSEGLRTRDQNSKMGRNEVALIFRKNLTKECSNSICTRL